MRFLTALDINAQYDNVWIVLVKNRKPGEPAVLSAVSHSAYMSIIKVCTQLGVLHLWSVKIYESQRRKIYSSLSLSLWPVLLSLVLQLSPSPPPLIISSGVSRAQLAERDGSGTICLRNPLLLISVCLCMRVVTPAGKNRRESAGGIGWEVSDGGGWRELKRSP